MDSRIYLLVTLLCYAVGALHVLLFSVLRRATLTTVSVTATLLGFAFHTAALAQRWTEAGHFPALGLHDGASFLAWAIVLVFVLVYVTRASMRLGLVRLSVRLRPGVHREPDAAADRADPTLESLYLPIHLFLAVLRLRGALRRLHDGRAVSVPGARANALAPPVLLPDPEPRALRHHRIARA